MKAKVLSVLVMAALAGMPAFAEVKATVDETGVSAQGLTAGGAAVVFGVTRTRDGWLRRVSQVALVETADLSGSLEWAPRDGVPPMSVWVVADLATGDAAVAVPAEMSVPELVAADGRRVRVGDLASGRIVAGLAEADILVVRPGEGAWRLHVGDGGESDSDRAANRALNVDLKSMSPMIEGPGKPHGVRRGDLIAVIDPRAMAYLLERVGS